MELKYCESCGEILNVDTSKQDTFLNQFICKSCQSGGSAKGQPDMLTEAIEPPEVTGSSPLSFLDDSSGKSKKSKESRDLTLDSSLDLFPTEHSSKRVRKQGTKSKKSGLAPTKRTSSQKQSLDLFSEQTIIARKKKHFGTRPSTPEVQIQLIVEGSLEEDKDKDLALPPNPSGSEMPARTATRIQFHCLYCKSKLVVKPVKKTCKMSCPGCSNKMYIDSKGHLSRRHPERNTSVLLTKSGAIIPNPRPPAKNKKSEESPHDQKSQPGPGENLSKKNQPSSQTTATREKSPVGLSPLHESQQLPPSVETPGESTPPSKDSVSFDETLIFSGETRNEFLEALTEKTREKSPEEGPEALKEELLEGESSSTLPDSDVEKTLKKSHGASSFKMKHPLKKPKKSQHSTAVPEEPLEDAQDSHSGKKKEVETAPIQPMEDKESSMGSYLQATLFGFLLAAPLFLLGYLLSPSDSVVDAEDGFLQSSLEKTGTTVQQGLDRLIDKLGEWSQ